MFSPLALSAANDSINYAPQIHGTFRGRYEYSTQHGDQRFQVRNARVSLAGQVSRSINYFIQTDLCDRGKMKILDAWGQLAFSSHVRLKGGQFRMPFGVETFAAPHNYMFANRAFMGKTMCNYRAVGAQLSYQGNLGTPLPFTFEGGMFNPSTIGDHTGWHKNMAYSAKTTVTIGNTLLSAGFMSIEPDSVRTNLIDVAGVWKHNRWTVGTEYMYEHYTRKAHREAHSYLIQANYAMPVKLWEFNRLSFQGRFDGITAHSSASRNSEGLLVTDSPARNRVTIGGTLTHAHSKGIYADLRLNYEKYFYHSGVTTTAESGDKLVAELVIRF